MKDRCAYWFLTINPNADCYKDFDDYIKLYFLNNPKVEYAYIYHSAENESENDNHIHLTLYYRGACKRFTTIQNEFRGAHIEMTNQARYKRCIQYLIHLNDSDKTQYNENDIISNINTIELNEILLSNGYDFEQFDSSKIQEYMSDCMQSQLPNMYYFLNRFGIDAIKQYYFIIKDLLKMEYLTHTKSLPIELKDDTIDSLQ